MSRLPARPREAASAGFSAAKSSSVKSSPDSPNIRSLLTNKGRSVPRLAAASPGAGEKFSAPVRSPAARPLRENAQTQRRQGEGAGAEGRAPQSKPPFLSAGSLIRMFLPHHVAHGALVPDPAHGRAPAAGGQAPVAPVSSRGRYLLRPRLPVRGVDHSADYRARTML